MCGPTCVQHRKHSCRPARAGSVSGKVVGSRGPGARTGSVEPADGFWTTRVAEGPEGRYTPQGHRRVRRGIARLRDERRICLVELIDADRRKDMTALTGKCWQLVGRISIRETHHFTFIVARACLCANHPNNLQLSRWQPFPPSPQRFPNCGVYEGAIGCRSLVHPHCASTERRRVGRDVG